MFVDPLSDVLSLLKPETYVAGGFELGREWSLSFPAHDGIKCYAVLAGRCYFVVGEGEVHTLEEGDCALLPGGSPFRITNDLLLDPLPFEQADDLEWKGGLARVGGGGDTILLGGHFAFIGTHADLLFHSMPPFIRLRQSTEQVDMRDLLARMHRELTEKQPGGVLVSQHLAHLILVQTLRLYLKGWSDGDVGWLFALADDRLSTALRAMHSHPGRPWRLSSLADAAGMSRSNFARQFTATVGTSPIEYLTRWRMLLASSKLSEGNQQVADIALAMGYESHSSFSTAFKRVMGVSPGHYARNVGGRNVSHPWTATAAGRPINN